MTVLAYDGKILAADRQGSEGDYIGRMTKIRLLKNGSLFAGAGSASLMNEMEHWLNSGADPELMPSRQRGNDTFSVIFVLPPGGPLYLYENSPVPLIQDQQPFTVAGNGREFCLGALHAGKNSLEAVEITSRICKTCGVGIDYAIVSQDPMKPHGKIQRLVFEEPKLVAVKPNRLRAA